MSDNYQIITRSRKNAMNGNNIKTDSSDDEDYVPNESDSETEDYNSDTSVESEDDSFEPKKKYITRSKRKRSFFDEDYESESMIELNGEDKEMIGNILGKYILECLDDNEDFLDESSSENPPAKKSKINYNSNDKRYFNNLDQEEKDKIIDIETQIKEINTSIKPLRFNIIQSNLDINTKAHAIKKLDTCSNMDPNSGEYHKIKNWIDGLLKIPFGNYIDLELNSQNSSSEINDFLIKSQSILNKKVFGHKKAKSHILQIISKWIVNPQSLGNVLAIQGSMGIGKTTLVKEGISKCLNRPCYFISLGGATDSSFLDGHSYTYEGSQPGRIIEILKNAQCMNPIIYFDELDKISNTYKGDEITNLLIHITDSSQNSHFQDKYYTGIDIDLSRCLFIFSYNNIENVNPILLDRMYNIQLDDFTLEDKITISMNYLLPEILENFNISKEDIIFDSEQIRYIILKHSEDKGVRNIKRSLETIISKINLLKLSLSSNLDLEFNIDNLEFPLKVENNLIDILLDISKKCGPPSTMYT